MPNSNATPAPQAAGLITLSSAGSDAPLVAAWGELQALEASLEARPLDDPATDALDRIVELRAFIETYPASTYDGFAVQTRLALAEAHGTQGGFAAILRGEQPADLEWPLSNFWHVIQGMERAASQFASVEG